MKKTVSLLLILTLMLTIPVGINTAKSENEKTDIITYDDFSSSDSVVSAASGVS